MFREIADWWKKAVWWKKILIVIGIPLVILVVVFFAMSGQYISLLFNRDKRRHVAQQKKVEKIKERIDSKKEEVNEFAERRKDEERKIEVTNEEADRIIDELGGASSAEELDSMRTRIRDLSRKSEN